MTAAVALLLFAAAPAAARSVLDSEVSYELAVYWLAPGPTPAELQKLMPGFADDAVTLHPADMSRYAPPDPGMLQYFGRGLTLVQINEVQKAVSATRFVVRAPAARRFEVYEKVSKAVFAAAKKWKGYPWDEATRELFTPAEFQKRRLDTWKNGKPVAGSHIVGHFYENDATGHRLVTLGMQKFGLPDLSIDGATPAFGRQLQVLANFTAQQLISSPVLSATGEVRVPIEPTSDGAKTPTTVTVTLQEAVPQEGDAPNALYTFVFPGSGARTARMAALLKAAFGFVDEVQRARTGDAELEAARDRARTRLAALKKRFPGLRASLESLHVKAPFDHEGQREWMWVEVQRWQGDSLVGVLLNEPELVPGLKRGDIVTVKQADLFDYVVNLRDGGTEGGETNEILKKMRQ